MGDSTRRRVLRSIAAGGSVTLAGCTLGSGSSSTATEDATGTAAGTSTATPTPTPGSDSLEAATAIAPAEGDRGDRFGKSIALSADGRTALVGAPRDEGAGEGAASGEPAEEAGAAYVFTRSGGDWQEVATLTPEAGADRLDWFGDAVALSGDGSTALVGAQGDEQLGMRTGAVYAFSRSDGDWDQTATLSADAGDPDDLFGTAVALSRDGSTALVGASGDTDANPAGAAYVFSRSSTGWRQRVRLGPDDGDEGDSFGDAVALSADGRTALVEAEADEDPNGREAGSAYVFAGSGESWAQQAKLVPEDGDSGDLFGSDVALSADGATALVGALWDEDPNGDSAGSAYLFTGADGNWQQADKIAAADGDSLDSFGRSVALADDGGRALVGAPNDEDPNGDSAGSAYLFEGSAGEWRQTAKLAPASDDDGGEFGQAVALSGEGSIGFVGARRNDRPSGENGGTAYAFDLPGSK